MMAYTIWKHKLVRMNKILAYSWSVLMVLRVVLEVFDVQRDSRISFAMTIFNAINIVMFTIILFQLKSMHIYMDTSLKTESAVHQALINMRFLRNSYLVCISIHMITSYVVALFLGRD